MLRALTVTGSLRALRSVHYLVHELFTDPMMLATAPLTSNLSSSSSSSSSSRSVSARDTHVDAGAMSRHNNGFTPGVQALSFGSLVTYGVLPETVRQLR